MIAVADQGTDPELGGGEVFLPVIALPINISCSETASIAAANGSAVSAGTIVMTDGRALQVLVTDKASSFP